MSYVRDRALESVLPKRLWDLSGLLFLLQHFLTTDLSKSYLCRKIVALLQVILFLLLLALDSHATSIVP
jgi:hypothetical protein